MQEIQYIGENLMPGHIGHFMVILGFVAALLAAYSYYMASREERIDNRWRNIGRFSFLVHGVAVLTIISVIFYVMINQYYEYQYVWAHVNEELPFQYIFSAFWEGQEGSFLLWMFWHVILGVILIFTARKWESPVMGTVALAEAVLASMILGVYIGFGDDPARIGSNPLVLLRDVMEAPIFNNADYLTLIEGNGLNPLLQNYWMTIHPPTLFLGFASTLVPFAYAVAGVIKKDYTGWLKPVLPWALFSGAILGLGILMGGAWAYEALSFGGYWAWDPVENMSLVPWLVLVAGIHTNLIARSTGYSVRSTYIFYGLTFLLVLYSTFLTRSGVLGDTSVHAFTEMGLEVQLVMLISIFTLLTFVPFALHYRNIPGPKQDEPVASREFWMFLGSLILLFSALMITASTSLPVYNKIMEAFNPAFEGRTIADPVAHYNKYQLWIGVFIGLMSGFTQYLRWKERNWQSRARSVLTRMGLALVVTAVLTWLLSRWLDAFAWQYIVLLYAGVFTIVCNLDYLFFFTRTNLRSAATSFGHLGFGLLIVGVLFSSLNKFHISSNPFAQRGLIEEERLDRNIMLFEGLPMFMSGYRVTYAGDTFEGNNRVYDIRFEELNENGDVVDSFSVHPTALYDNKITKVAAYNPDTKHYLHKDVFTHIASIPLREADAEAAKAEEDSLKFRDYYVPENGFTTLRDTFFGGDSTIYRQYEMRFGGWEYTPEHPGYHPEPGDLTIGARIDITDPRRDTTYSVHPMLALRGSLLYTYPVQLQPVAMKIRLNENAMNRVFVPEEELDYTPYTLTRGQTFEHAGLQIRFDAFDTRPEHPEYDPEKSDIAVGARFLVLDKAGSIRDTLSPMYLIRENRPYNLKDASTGTGLHLRFTALDPNEETIEIYAARKIFADEDIAVQVAKSPRTDFIILESIVFPGINLVWVGSLLMLAGLLLGSINRLRK